MDPRPERTSRKAQPLEARPFVASESVTFRYLDVGDECRAVTLVQEVVWPREGPPFYKGARGMWEVELLRPPVDRMEYRFELVYEDESESGSATLVLDPANPRTAPGAFGERSVIEFPEYSPPWWVSDPTGDRRDPLMKLSIPAPSLGSDQPCLLWSPPESSADEELPLLVVLDGLEFARFSRLDRMLDLLVGSGELPRMRALLLHPAKRDDDYSASPEFAGALAGEILPAVSEIVGVKTEPRFRVGLGASLGGLAMMHAHTEHPGVFGGLFLQSSSFLFGSELPSLNLARITRFVDDLLARGLRPAPVPVLMTCGTVEQNLANNRAILAALAEQGYPAELHVVRDAHNWIAWRDAWTPHLPAFLRGLWE